MLARPSALLFVLFVCGQGGAADHAEPEFMPVDAARLAQWDAQLAEYVQAFKKLRRYQVTVRGTTSEVATDGSLAERRFVFVMAHDERENKQRIVMPRGRGTPPYGDFDYLIENGVHLRALLGTRELRPGSLKTSKGRAMLPSQTFNPFVFSVIGRPHYSSGLLSPAELQLELEEKPNEYAELPTGTAWGWRKKIPFPPNADGQDRSVEDLRELWFEQRSGGMPTTVRRSFGLKAARQSRLIEETNTKWEQLRDDLWLPVEIQSNSYRREAASAGKVHILDCTAHWDLDDAVDATLFMVDDVGQRWEALVVGP